MKHAWNGQPGHLPKVVRWAILDFALFQSIEILRKLEQLEHLRS